MSGPDLGMCVSRQQRRGVLTENLQLAHSWKQGKAFEHWRTVIEVSSENLLGCPEHRHWHPAALLLPPWMLPPVVQCKDSCPITTAAHILASHPCPCSLCHLLCWGSSPRAAPSLHWTSKLFACLATSWPKKIWGKLGKTSSSLEERKIQWWTWTSREITWELMGKKPSMWFHTEKVTGLQQQKL